MPRGWPRTVCGAAPAAGLAAQASAPPPFAVHHDLRWILVYHHSWWMPAAELVAMLLFRTARGTALVALLWPAARPRPALRRLAVSQLLFTVLDALLLSLLLSRGGLAPGWILAAAALAAFVTLSAASALISAVPGPWKPWCAPGPEQPAPAGELPRGHGVRFPC